MYILTIIAYSLDGFDYDTYYFADPELSSLEFFKKEFLMKFSENYSHIDFVVYRYKSSDRKMICRGDLCEQILL